jgi:two-component system nitrogen regulation sensor histidine kinase GlnL
MIDNHLNPVEILRHTTACLIVADSDLQIQYINPAVEELFRLSERQLSGMQIHELFLDGDLDKARFQLALASNQTTYQRHSRIMLANREWITADISLGLYSSNGENLLLLELHPHDRQFNVGPDSPEYGQHLAANALLRGLGHEIKNPLGGLRGAAQLLAMELSNDDLAEYTEVIIKEADRLTTLVDRMMTPHKAGDKVLCNIHEPIENALNLVVLEMADGITIKRNYDPSIPEIMMFPDGLQQAFLNIIQNGIQAMDGNGVLEVETRVGRHMILGDKQHTMVIRINISDTGPGVPESLKDRIFMPMVSGKSDGTGLGLGVAQNILRQHQGMIEYRDNLPLTTFSVFVPLIMEGE